MLIGPALRGGGGEGARPPCRRRPQEVCRRRLALEPPLPPPQKTKTIENRRDVKGSVAATVLQYLLGGGGSFSTGGPGKGMHSRLYTRVLNQLPWVHNCTAFNSIYNSTGLVGAGARRGGGRAVPCQHAEPHGWRPALSTGGRARLRPAPSRPPPHPTLCPTRWACLPVWRARARPRRWT